MEISVARKRLEEMRADLDRTVSILTGEHHLVRGGGAEAGDAGANLTEADRNAAAMETATAQRAEVIAALARIDDGSYGRCVDCAGPVPEPRLEARPATARCVPCQTKRDRRRLRWRLPALNARRDQLRADRVIGTGVQFRVDQRAEA
jgi:DnaK suppressor protein